MANEVSAILKGVRISPQKARLVADLIRGKKVDNALDILKFSPKKAAEIIKRVVESAIANAENNHDLDIDKLIVSEAYVGKALVMKRFRPRARGRGAKILKPISNLTVIVKENQEEV